jgi:hypothetical protein
MTTFAELYTSLGLPPKEGRLLVVYPDGFIRSNVFSVDSNIDWVDQSPVEGARFKIICDLKSQFIGIYKVTGWELVGPSSARAE